MLQNAYFLAKIGADTAEIEQHFTEIRFRAAGGGARGGGGEHRAARCITSSVRGRGRPAAQPAAERSPWLF